MLLVAAAGTLATRVPAWSALGSLRGWAVGGCVASAFALFAMALAGLPSVPEAA